MIVPVLAAVVVAVAGVHVRIVDERAVPVAGAAVTFRDAAGAVRRVTSETDGEADPPAGSEPVSLTVAAGGFEAQTLTLDGARATIVVRLHATIIGRVTVATGSARNVHELAVPATTIDASAIARSPSFTTDALLRTLPGFDRTRSNSAFTNYGQLRVSFAGAGNDRGIVFADGVPAQDGFGGQVDWLAYPPQALTGVELLRGSGSSLYGANGVGGVLQLSEFAPSSNPAAAPDGVLDIAGGTRDRYDGGVRLRAPIAGRLSAAVVTQTRESASADLAPGYQSPIDRLAVADSSSTRAVLRYAAGDATTIDLGTLEGNDTQFEGRQNYTFARNLGQTDLRIVSTGAHARVEVVGYLRDTDVTNVNDMSPKAPGALLYTQRIPTREGGASATVFLDSASNDFAIRADTRFVNGESDQFGPTGALTVIGAGAQQYDGAALEDTFERGRFQLIGGLRADRVAFTSGRLFSAGKNTFVPDRTDNVLSPRLALRYDVAPQVALRVSDGTGFREPFLNELLRGYSIGAISYQPNANLIPERSHGTNVGIDTLGTRSHLSLDLTETVVNDAIQFITIAPNVQQRANVARTRSDSTTLAYQTTVARCTTVTAYGTGQYARVLAGPAADIAKRIPYVPDKSAGVSLDATAGTVHGGISAALLGKAYADDLNTQALNSAVVVDAYLTAMLGGGRSITLQGANVNGAHYLSSIDRYGPEPSIELRVRIPLGPVPAQPRC